MIQEKIVPTFATNIQSRLMGLVNIFIPLAIVLGAASGVMVVILGQPFFILLGLAGLIVFLLTIYSSEFGLFVLVFISYTRFSDIITEFHGFPSTAKPFIAILIASIFVRWVVFGERPKGWLGPAVLFGLLSLIGFVSLLYSPVPDRVMARWLDDIKDMAIALIVIILLQQGPTFRRVLWVLIGVGVFLGTLAVYQYLTGNFDNVYGGFAISLEHQIIGTIDDYRSTGPIGDPNFFAQIMVVLVPISLERFLHEKKNSLRLIALWAFAMSTLTVIFTYSRGGLLAAVISIAVVLFYYPPKQFQIPVIIFSLVVFVSLLPPNYLDRVLTLTDLFKPRGTLRIEERSFQGRLSENLAALEMIKANPLFGVGLNSYKYLFPVYSKRLGLALVATEREAHNLFLEIAAETGVIGFSMFIFILFACFQNMFRGRTLFLRADMKDYAGMVTGFMGGFVGYFVAAIFIHNAFPRYFYLLIGLALSIHLVTRNTIAQKLDSE